jgi:hypothetical protein
MTKDIRVEYNHTSGALEVCLPSGTRVGFKKESGGQVFAFLTWCHMQEKERLKWPLDQKTVDALRKKWTDDGHTTIKPLEAAKDINLEELGL